MNSSSASSRFASAIPYEPSGRLGPALFMLPLVMLVATPWWAIIYAYVCFYVPASYGVALLFVFVFALGIGRVIRFVAFRSRCRSAMFVALIGLLSAIYGLYGAWVTFEYLLLRRDDPQANVGFWDLASSPEVVWETAKKINVAGWCKFADFRLSGIALWVNWGIEAAIVMAVGLFSFRSLPARMYCEWCNRWCDEPHEGMRFAAPANLESLHDLAAGDIRQIGQLQPPWKAGRLEPLVELAINRCENCRDLAGIRVSLVKRQIRKLEGRELQKAIPLGPFVLLTHDAYQELEAQVAALQRGPGNSM